MPRRSFLNVIHIVGVTIIFVHLKVESKIHPKKKDINLEFYSFI